MSDNDWLDTEPAKELAEIKERPEYQKALAALSALSKRQRRYLDALVDADLEPDAGRKLMFERHHVRLRRAEVEHWLQGDPVFAEALQAIQKFICSAVAIGKAALVSKLNRLANDTRRLVPVKDRQGNEFLRPVDASAAHSALVSLAKISGVLGEEQAPTVREGPGLVIQINAPGSPQPVIDVTPERVAITLPEPDK